MEMAFPATYGVDGGAGVHVGQQGGGRVPHPRGGGLFWGGAGHQTFVAIQFKVRVGQPVCRTGSAINWLVRKAYVLMNSVAFLSRCDVSTVCNCTNCNRWDVKLSDDTVV